MIRLWCIWPVRFVTDIIPFCCSLWVDKQGHKTASNFEDLPKGAGWLYLSIKKEFHTMQASNLLL